VFQKKGAGTRRLNFLRLRRQISLDYITTAPPPNLTQLLPIPPATQAMEWGIVFRLILANRVKYWSRALRQKGIILRALMWAATSLWPQKVVCRSHIYLARAKLMLISEQARDLAKDCFEGRPVCVPFKTARLHPGSWIIDCVRKVYLSLRGESKTYWERERERERVETLCLFGCG